MFLAGGDKITGKTGPDKVCRLKLKHDIDKLKDPIAETQKALIAVKSVAQVRDKVLGTKKGQLNNQLAQTKEKVSTLDKKLVSQRTEI